MSEQEITLSQLTDSKQTVSARVNSHVVEMYKDSGIPLTLVIENSLISFLKRSDKEKIEFLSENMPDKVKVNELATLPSDWKDLLSNYLGKVNIPSKSASTLLSGLGVGAVALLGALIVGDFFGKD